MLYILGWPTRRLLARYQHSLRYVVYVSPICAYHHLLHAYVYKCAHTQERDDVFVCRYASLTRRARTHSRCGRVGTRTHSRCGRVGTPRHLFHVCIRRQVQELRRVDFGRHQDHEVCVRVISGKFALDLTHTHERDSGGRSDRKRGTQIREIRHAYEH